MTENEREIVLESLIEILEKNQFSHIVEKNVLDKYDYLDQAKKSFIKRVTEGTVENLINIDEVINKFSKIQVNKMKPLIRNLIRMSVYQLLYMDKIPDSAVCNEAVKLAGKRGFRSLSGFVNGVLRNIARNKDTIDTKGDNLPVWIKDHLVECYGEGKARLVIDDINKIHPVTLRARGTISDKDKARLSKTGIIENSYYVKEGVSLSDLEGFIDGRLIVQDVASMIPVMEAHIKKGDRVLDVCASPGGKSIQAYDCGANVIARDVSENKVSIIKENIYKYTKNDNDVSNIIEAQVYDARNYDASLNEKMDVVIADLPCSGLGVLGRKSDIRHKTKKEDLESIVSLQREIIDTVWKYVKTGGVLMYSTCTMNPKENEEQVKYILSNFPFSLEYEKQFLPGIDNTDGFYVARLRRND